MTKALLIDSAGREIREVEYDGSAGAGLKAIRQFIGGWIEAVYQWPNGDVLYTDEEALLKPTMHFFRLDLREGDQPLGGNGVVVGRELLNRQGDFLGNADVGVTAEEVRPHVQFLSREQVDAWGKANASEAASFFTSIGRDGSVEREVTGRWGEIIGRMPRRAEYTWRLEGDVLVLIDKNQGGLSVTNDAEAVIQDLVRLGYNVDALRIIYRDTEWRWDGLLTKDGKFAGFRPIRGRDGLVTDEATAIAHARACSWED